MPGVNDQVVDSVASTNFKTMGDGPAFYTGLAYGNAVSHQARMNTISEASVGRLVKAIVEPDPMEALSGSKMASSDLPVQMSQLLSALSSGQIGGKVAQTMPPVSSPDLS
jgi:hypothetical protein